MCFALVVFHFQEVTSLHLLCFLELHLEEQGGHAGEVDREHQAEALQVARPSLLQGAGGDMMVENETAEVCQVHKHCKNLPHV